MDSVTDKTFTLDFLKGSAFTFSATASGTVFHTISLMLIAHNLGPADVGAYVLILAMVHLLTIFAGLGLDLTLTKFTSSHGPCATNSALLMPAVVMRLAALGAIAAIFLAGRNLWVGLFDANLGRYASFVLGLCALGSFRDLFLHLLQGARRFRSYALIQISFAILKCGLILTAAAAGALNLEIVIRVEAFSLLVEVGLLFLTLREFAGPVFGQGGTYSELLRFSMPLYANNLLTVFNDRAGVFMVGALLNPAGMAYLGVAERIPQGFTRLFSSFITVYFPNMSRFLASGDREAASRLMNRFIQLSSAAILSLVLIVFLFRDDIMRILFSAGYIASGFTCFLLMLAMYLRSVANIMGYSLVSAGLSSLPVKANTISCIINIAANAMLIPAFGFPGAAGGLLAMNAACMFIYSRYLARAGMPVSPMAFVPAAAAAATAGVYLLTGNDAAFVKILFALLYAAVCIRFVPVLRQLSTAAFGRFHGFQVRRLDWTKNEEQ